MPLKNVYTPVAQACQQDRIGQNQAPGDGGRSEPISDLWAEFTGIFRGTAHPLPQPWGELFGPLRSGAADDLVVVGQIGQSLDGRIATASGHSKYINGPAGLAHLHRLRALVDAVVIEENTGSAVATWAAQGWVATYPPEKFWLLAYSTDVALLSGTLAVARANNIGLVYVTDDVEPNPWDALPSYLDELVVEVGP